MPNYRCRCIGGRPPGEALTSAARARRTSPEPALPLGARRSTPRDGTASPTSVARGPRTPVPRTLRSTRGRETPRAGLRSHRCDPGRRRRSSGKSRSRSPRSSTRIGRKPCSTLSPTSISPPAKPCEELHASADAQRRPSRGEHGFAERIELAWIARRPGGRRSAQDDRACPGEPALVDLLVV